MGVWEGRGWFFYVRVSVEVQGLLPWFVFYFLFCFCPAVNCSFIWLLHDSLLCLFHYSFFPFFVSCTFKLGLTSAWKLLCLFCKTIPKLRFLITTLWISLKKGERLDFNHPLGNLPLFYTIRIRLLGQVYHFSLLLCYPYSFLFHALRLVILLERKLLLMTLGKTRN